MSEMEVLFTAQLAKDMRSPLLPVGEFRASCNAEYERVNTQGNTVLVNTIAPASIREGSLSSRNNITAIPATAFSITQEEFKVDRYADYRDVLNLKLIQTIEGVESLSAKIAMERTRQLEQAQEVHIASKFLQANIHNIISGFETTASAGVSDGSTTIPLTSVTNLVAGDILHIEATSGDTVVALVKSIASLVVTIETNTALFPKGGALENLNQFQSLVTSLPAISSGAIVKSDKPVSTTVSNFYDGIVDAMNLPLNHNVSSGDFRIAISPKLLGLLQKKDAAPVQNDVLGANIIGSGNVKEIAGGYVIGNGNAICRKVNGTWRYLVACYKNKQAIHSINWFDAVEINPVPDQVGARNINALSVYDTKVFKQGAKAVSLMWISL